MKLHDFCEALEATDLPAADEASAPVERVVRGARDLLAMYIVDDAFLGDCLRMQVELIVGSTFRRGLRPFLRLPRTGVEFAFGHWAPGGGTDPHEHTAWTITGVCRNALEVTAFDREASILARRLVVSRTFVAPEGAVGFVHRPCIHAPRNHTSGWTLTLHLISPRDGVDHRGGTATIPELAPLGWVGDSDMTERRGYDSAHPFVSVLTARQRSWQLAHIASVLTSFKCPVAPELLIRLFDAATTTTKTMLYANAPDCREARADPQCGVVLERTHRNLNLSIQSSSNGVTLFADTLMGPRQQMSGDDRATAALQYVARAAQFDSDDLPGELSGRERRALAERLEDSGLFRRVA